MHLHRHLGEGARGRQASPALCKRRRAPWQSHHAAVPAITPRFLRSRRALQPPTFTGSRRACRRCPTILTAQGERNHAHGYQQLWSASSARRLRDTYAGGIPSRVGLLSIFSNSCRTWDNGTVGTPKVFHRASIFRCPKCPEVPGDLNALLFREIRRRILGHPFGAAL